MSEAKEIKKDEQVFDLEKEIEEIKGKVISIDRAVKAICMAGLILCIAKCAGVI